jgi:hypothetical protein
MTAAIAILTVLVLIWAASRLFGRFLDSYLKDDKLFDEEMSRQECEALLKAASKAPKKRAF